jgi:hypothetical protein
MKVADIIGFTAIAAGAAYAGYQSYPALQAGVFPPPYLTWVDYLIVFGLLAVGFYFSAVLS